MSAVVVSDWVRDHDSTTRTTACDKSLTNHSRRATPIPNYAPDPPRQERREDPAAAMDDLYDDFGNYIGPELVEYERAPP